MKKILLLAAGLVAALSVSAQTLPMQARVQKQNPTLQQEVQKQVLTPSNSIVKANVANNKVAVPVRKSNYTSFAWLTSQSFAEIYAGADNLEWQGGEIDLFPDSMAIVSTWYYTNDGTVSASNGFFHKVGGVFDPYSYAFSSDFDKMLNRVDKESGEEYYFGFESNDTTYYYNYRIDTIIICMDYVMGPEKDSALLGHEAVPDTVRVYMAQYDVYSGFEGRGVDYNYLTYTEETNYPGVHLLVPTANYLKDPSTQKGSVTVPQSASLQTFDYILDPNGADSVQSALGRVGYKGRKIPVNYEVEAGNVVAIMYEFLPGYDYTLNDTLSSVYYNGETKEFINKEQFKSTLSIPYANFYTLPDMEVRNFDWTLDMGGGVNGKLAEDNDIRYGSEMTEFFQGHYLHYYYVNPIYWFHLSLGDDNIFYYDDDVEEADALQVSVYPNPAQDKINVNLSNDEQAIATLYNIVGQQVNTYNLEGANNVLDLSGVASGIYMLKVQQGDKTNTVKVTVK